MKNGTKLQIINQMCKFFIMFLRKNRNKFAVEQALHRVHSDGKGKSRITEMATGS